jgi:hypothetical protein
MVQQCLLLRLLVNVVEHVPCVSGTYLCSFTTFFSILGGNLYSASLFLPSSMLIPSCLFGGGVGSFLGFASDGSSMSPFIRARFNK